MAEKILACPYQCITNKFMSVETENGKEYYVECDCGARGPIAYSSDDAVDMWNAAANALAAKDEEIADKKRIIEDMFVTSVNVQAENLKLSNELYLEKRRVAAGDKRQDELEAEIARLTAACDDACTERAAINPCRCKY